MKTYAIRHTIMIMIMNIDGRAVSPRASSPYVVFYRAHMAPVVIGNPDRLVGLAWGGSLSDE